MVGERMTAYVKVKIVLGALVNSIYEKTPVLKAIVIKKICPLLYWI